MFSNPMFSNLLSAIGAIILVSFALWILATSTSQKFIKSSDLCEKDQEQPEQ